MDDERGRSTASEIQKRPRVADPHVQEVIKAARDELRQAVQQRADAVKRIGTIKQTIVGLANMFGDEVLTDELQGLVDRRGGGRPAGFTKACRVVMIEARRPLGAREVQQQLEQRYPSLLLRHKDPLASITTVPNRLANYGEAKISTGESGRKEWQWVADGSDGFVVDGGIPVDQSTD